MSPEVQRGNSHQNMIFRAPVHNSLVCLFWSRVGKVKMSEFQWGVDERIGAQPQAHTALPLTPTRVHCGHLRSKLFVSTCQPWWFLNGGCGFQDMPLPSNSFFLSNVVFWPMRPLFVFPLLFASLRCWFHCDMYSKLFVFLAAFSQLHYFCCSSMLVVVHYFFYSVLLVEATRAKIHTRLNKLRSPVRIALLFVKVHFHVFLGVHRMKGTLKKIYLQSFTKIWKKGWNVGCKKSCWR